MGLQRLIKEINKSLENLDLVTARMYIENNYENLKENKFLLERDARALFEFIQTKIEKGERSLNRNEMNVLYAINSYATNFDVRGLQMSVKNNAELLLKEDVRQYLNEDAKAILSGMRVI